MSSNVISENVFSVRIFRTGSSVADETICVLALDDALARSIAIQISNLGWSRLWKCGAEEVERKAPVVLCDIRRVFDKETGSVVVVRSLV